MGSEQDRGWTIKTERDYTYLRGSARSFYESRATHPVYGETIPARSIDEETVYKETLARIARIESQVGPASAMPMMPTAEISAMSEVGEAEGALLAQAETEGEATEAADMTATDDAKTDTAHVSPPMYDLSSAIPMPVVTYPGASLVSTPAASGGSEQESEPVGDPLAAEFGYNTRPLNLTRRVENGLANHRRLPRRRPTGHIILK